MKILSRMSIAVRDSVTVNKVRGKHTSCGTIRR